MMKKIFLILLVLVIISVYKINDNNVIIPDSSIRLRIIPNSNSPEDINIKEKIKNNLESNIYLLLKDVDDIDEARNIINDNIPDIKDNIDNILNDNSYTLPYYINYGYNYFPNKEYRGVKYDDGFYESLVITIGDGKGDNWWCVLFPNFCLIDKDNTDKYEFYIDNLIKKYSKKKMKE